MMLLDRRFMAVCFALCFLCACRQLTASDWSVTPRGSATLNVDMVGDVQGMSGVTFIGDEDGVARLLAVQDSMGLTIDIRVSLSADGTITSADAAGVISLGVDSDYEGIALSHPLRNSLYIADESTAMIREFDLATGDELGSFVLPQPFQSQRSNFGVESLARMPDGRTLWTANEQALSIDGPLATGETGTTVRLAEVIVSDEFAFSPGRQFAYEVESVHGIHSPSNGSRSGLVDLVSLPDGGLLSLERSLAFDPQTSLPTFESRIYEIELAGATDVSDNAFDAGLEGMAYTSAGKRLLWRGQAGGFLGQNLEGLTLAHQLESGSWSLLGVVDDGDPLSGDTVVAFELARVPLSLPGDYNGSGRVEQGDLDLVLLHWGEVGQPSPAGWTAPEPVGIIDQGELDGVLLHWGESAIAALAVPEPPAWLLLTVAASTLAMARKCHPRPIYDWPRFPLRRRSTVKGSGFFFCGGRRPPATLDADCRRKRIPTPYSQRTTSAAIPVL